LALLVTVITASFFLGLRSDGEPAYSKRSTLFFLTNPWKFKFAKDMSMLILRAIDDEASLVLASGAIGNRLSLFASYLIFRLLIYAVLLIFAPYLISALAIWAVKGGSLDNAFVFLNGFLHFPENYLTILNNGMVPTVFLCLALIFSSAAFKCVYGREFLFESMALTINAQSSPDLAGPRVMALTFTGNRRKNAFRHYIYDDPRCAAAIVTWMIAFAQQINETRLSEQPHIENVKDEPLAGV
jgi:hypothetical protein